MNYQAYPPCGSPEELHRHPPSCSGRPATHTAKKVPPLRIIVPPTEYCPFSTDLTLPITPLSLPTPVSSSCFTFSDTQERAIQCVPAPPMPALVLSPCSLDTAVADFASPTSSQFLLMPPAPRLEDVDIEAAICVSPLVTSSPTDEPMCSGSNGTKSENPRPWEPSPSTWLTDLGGHTETDRIFRRNLLDVALVDTDNSPASTPALSPSAASPSSQVSSILTYNLLTSLARTPAPSSPTLSPHMYAKYPQSSPARLALKPMGTDAFPSTLEGLQAWRDSVTPGFPQSTGPCPPLPEEVHDSQLEEPASEGATTYPFLPSHQSYSHQLFPVVPRVPRSRNLLQHAKMLGGRVKRLVTRQGVDKHRGSMDRGVNFRVVTSQDSENGSVILITAPPPPYDVHPPTPSSHEPTGQEHARSRTISEYSSAVHASTVELPSTGMTESGSGQGDGNRNALRRLSLMALSTIKKF